MNPASIHFQCPHCRARIKAPSQMIGQGRDCPGCGRPFVVPRRVREDVGPILVLPESEGDPAFGVPHRRSA